MATKNEAPALMAIHPGSILKEELAERGISQKNFAKSIEMQPSHLSEIIKGKRSITKQVADKLEEVLERFERFGLPINFTENTFVSGELVPAHLDDLNDYEYKDDGHCSFYEWVNDRKLR